MQARSPTLIYQVLSRLGRTQRTSAGPVGGQPAAIGLGLAVSRTLAELMGGSLN